MMIEPENKAHDDDHKPVKGSGSAKAIPEARQNKANFCYHDIPLIVEGMKANSHIGFAQLRESYTFYGTIRRETSSS
jgi:hypothetical protein